MMILEIAEGGMFTRSGMTPIESAMSANLYESLHWMSVKKDQNRK